MACLDSFPWMGLVAIRVLVNPLSNVCQKELTHRKVDPVKVIQRTHALLVIPALLSIPFLTPPRAWLLFLASMTWCALLAVFSNVLLVQALKRADLSLLGPVNTYKSILGMGLAWIVLGEVPTGWGLLGMGLIFIGSYALMDRDPNPSSVAWVALIQNPGVQLRLAALVFSAAEAVFLKRAMEYADASTTMVAWILLGYVIAVGMNYGMNLWSQSQATRFIQEVSTRESANRWLWIALASTTGLMQWSTLLCFERVQVGYSLALFQLSAVVSVVMGYWFFRESHFGRRLIGAGLMTVGAILIMQMGRPAP
ncbi:MAG: EamA family transporter [Pirellulales bacterium]